MDKPLKAEKRNLTTKQADLNFSSPMLINNSDYVMYPLTVEKTQEGNEEYSSGTRGSATYWNIVFYNTASGEYHLLDETRRMVILSQDPGNQRSSVLSPDVDRSPKGGYQIDDLIYYTIATEDFNSDNELNSKDPHYLFISDKSGRKFKQISPEHGSVSSWTTIEGTNKILLRITRDSNGDKKFNAKDESVPFIYDLNKNSPSLELFDEGFKTRLRKQFEEQWLKSN